MELSGNGATFLELDVVMAKRILGMLTKAEFKFNAQETIYAGEAMMWFQNTLIPSMEKCVLEIKKVTKPVVVPDIELA